MMETVFISKLEPFLDAVAKQMSLYVPRKSGEHYVFDTYDDGSAVAFNEIRACTPVKEFLFPLRELAAVLPRPVEPEEVQPFAVFGLKACDLRSMEILDKVFTEKDFEDPFYIARRKAMFVIASDCSEPGDSCFCNILGGKPYPEVGYDLNVSPVPEGFLIAAGSAGGRSFLTSHAALFGDVPDTLLVERDKMRTEAQNRLQEVSSAFRLDKPVKEIIEQRYESEVFDDRARTCVECQACTRVCPTCHCFYLYDTKQTDYFAKMKMWDSCMRMGYAAVAGGGNPRKFLGDRLRHRLMHKFAYFLDRYGIDMCVGCGRCVDAEAGDVDIRVVLKKLSDELLDKDPTAAKTKT